MEQDVAPAEPADAAAAFDALRREVALLNVAVAGLAAERASAPDYSESLGEIAKGVSTTIGRLGKVMTSPALTTGPAEMARQIAAAADAAQHQDRALLQQARDVLQQASRDLQGWINSARLARKQNRRLMQIGAVGLTVGTLFGIWLPNTVAHIAPDRWAWPEKLAARTLDREAWAAGERLLEAADPPRWKLVRERLETGPSASKVCADDAPQGRLRKPTRRPRNRRALPGDR